MKIFLNKKILFWAITTLCIATLWKFQDIISVNIPWWDDFYGLMIPIQKLFSNATIAEKFHWFVSLNNEHRVVNDRFFMLLIYIFNGFSFNLKALALSGFINLIVIFLLIYKVAKPYVVNILYLLPIVFIIFQAQYFESLQSLMVPFQNFSVILYVILTFYLLVYNNNDRFSWALFFAILALYTHGNGILALLIGLLILLFQLRFKKALIWTLVCGLLVILYFIGYSKPAWVSTTSFLDHPFKSFLFVFEFLGAYSLNIVEISTSATLGNAIHWVPTFFGLLFTGVFLLIILNKYRIFSKNRADYFNKLRHSKIDIFLIACILFFIATGMLISISRTGFPIFSRYTINSSFYIAFIYVLVLLNFHENRPIVIFSGIFTFIILLLSYFNNFDEAIFRKKNLITDGINWRREGTWMNQYSSGEHIQNLNPLLNESFKKGTYTFPNTVLFNAENILASPLLDENPHFTIENGFIEISGKNTINHPNKKENGNYFILKSPANSFIFPAVHTSRNILGFIKSGKYIAPYFQGHYQISNLPKDVYSIYEIRVSKGIPKSYLLPFSFDNQGTPKITAKHF